MIKGRDAVFSKNTFRRSGGLHIGPEQAWLEGDPGICNVSVEDNVFDQLGNPPVELNAGVLAGRDIIVRNNRIVGRRRLLTDDEGSSVLHTLLDGTDQIAALIAPLGLMQLFPEASARLRPTAVVGASALALGLGCLGVMSLLAPVTASMAYGLPISAGSGGGRGGGGGGWVGVAGLRDLGIGIGTLGLLRSKAPGPALGGFLPGVLLIPAGDIALAAVHGDGGWATVLPHVAGVVAVGILMVAVAVGPTHRP